MREDSAMSKRDPGRKSRGAASWILDIATILTIVLAALVEAGVSEVLSDISGPYRQLIWVVAGVLALLAISLNHRARKLQSGAPAPLEVQDSLAPQPKEEADTKKRGRFPAKEAKWIQLTVNVNINVRGRQITQIDQLQFPDRGDHSVHTHSYLASKQDSSATRSTRKAWTKRKQSPARSENAIQATHKDRSIRTHYHFASEPSLVQRSVAVTDRVVVGRIPGEPVGWIERQGLTDIGEVFRQHRCVVCVGGRGTGKSTYAAAYAREVRADKELGARVIAWVSGETEQALVSGLASLAERLGVADRDGDADKSAVAARNHLAEMQDPSLLIIDNAEDVSLIQAWLPGGECRVLLTSTIRRFTDVAFEVPVGVFDRSESLEYLARRTGIKNDEKGANELADALGDLPLALLQATAVIRSQHLTYGQYLRQFQDLPIDEVLVKAGVYPRSLAAAVVLSVKAAWAEHRKTAGEDDRSVLDLLDAVSVLDPAGVPRELLFGVIQELAVAAGRDPESEDRLNRVVGVLGDFSLITFAEAADDPADESCGEVLSGVVMHRLVARVIRETRSESWRAHSTSLEEYATDVSKALATWVEDIPSRKLTVLVDFIVASALTLAGFIKRNNSGEQGDATFGSSIEVDNGQ